MLAFILFIVHIFSTEYCANAGSMKSVFLLNADKTKRITLVKSRKQILFVKS